MGNQECLYELTNRCKIGQYLWEIINCICLDTITLHFYEQATFTLSIIYHLFIGRSVISFANFKDIHNFL